MPRAAAGWQPANLTITSLISVDSLSLFGDEQIRGRNVSHFLSCITRIVCIAVVPTSIHGGKPRIDRDRPGAMRIRPYVSSRATPLDSIWGDAATPQP
jgi:hypothetical protein